MNNVPLQCCEVVPEVQRDYASALCDRKNMFFFGCSACKRRTRMFIRAGEAIKARNKGSDNND